LNIVTTNSVGVAGLAYTHAVCTHALTHAAVRKILCAVVKPVTVKQVALATLAATAPYVSAPLPHRIPAMGVPPVPKTALVDDVNVLAAVNPPLNVETLPLVVLIPPVAVTRLAVVIPRLKYA
jgi:hypothetical protein